MTKICFYDANLDKHVDAEVMDERVLLGVQFYLVDYPYDYGHVQSSHMILRAWRGGDYVPFNRRIAEMGYFVFHQSTARLCLAATQGQERTVVRRYTEYLEKGQRQECKYLQEKYLDKHLSNVFHWQGIIEAWLYWEAVIHVTRVIGR